MSASPSSVACRRTALAAVVMLALCGPAAADGNTDFVKAALAHGGFETFVGLVSRAGVADTLGSSPVTAFMPTDAAFARLSAAQRKSIADLSSDGVKDSIGRFLFPGAAMASNDIDKTITSENGTVYAVTWYEGRLSLRDHRGPATGRLAYVVEGDIPAGSGVIDAIDTVLMPVGGPAVPAVAAVAPAPGMPAIHPSSEAPVPAATAPTPLPLPSSDVASAAPTPSAPAPVAAPSQPISGPAVPPAAPRQAVPAPIVTGGQPSPLHRSPR